MKRTNDRRKNTNKTQPRIFLVLELVALYLVIHVLTFGFSLGQLNMLVGGIVIGYMLKSTIPRYNRVMMRTGAKNFIKRYAHNAPNDWTKNI
jgi:hypothetical protein